MNNNKRLKQRISALTLASTLFLGGCGSVERNNSFVLVENENNEIVAMEDSYIDNDYIGNYYVVEVYNKMKKENEVYIASHNKNANYWEYFDVFSNLEIVNNREDEEDLFSFIKVTELKDYIVSYGLGQLKYSYEDMKNIYEIIKENYVFEDDSSLRRKRVIDYKI